MNTAQKILMMMGVIYTFVGYVVTAIFAYCGATYQAAKGYSNKCPYCGNYHTV